MNQSLDDIIKNAEYLKKRYAQRNKGGKDVLYNFLKHEIVALNLPADEYEQAIKKLCDALDY
jgi:hypothetical protein